MSSAAPSRLRGLFARPEFSSLLIMVVMLVVTAILQNGFFTPASIVRNINAFTPLILLTMGQAVVIIAGGIDLSTGTALSLVTCVLTTVMHKSDPWSGALALVVAFAVAMAAGLINGIGIGYLRIPPVIVTFATSYIWLGAALFLRPTPGGQAVEWFKAFYNVGSIEGVSATAAAVGRVLPPALLLVIIGALFWFVVSKTPTGRYVYAVGGNIDSAFESGIDTARVQTRACLVNSVFVFLAALFFVGQNQSGDARLGDPLTLRAIAAAVVGGVALTGGRGSIAFAIVGALILSFVNKIIFFANIPNAYQTLVGGVIVILAVASSRAYSIAGRRGGGAGSVVKL